MTVTVHGLKVMFLNAAGSIRSCSSFCRNWWSFWNCVWICVTVSRAWASTWAAAAENVALLLVKTWRKIKEINVNGGDPESFLRAWVAVSQVNRGWFKLMLHHSLLLHDQAHANRSDYFCPSIHARGKTKVLSPLGLMLRSHVRADICATRNWICCN